MLTDADLERIRGIRPSFLGSLFYYVFPIRRRIVLENMRQVFGDSLDEADIRRLARCFYTHFLRVIVENLSMFWTSDRGLAARVEVQGEEHLFRAGEQGKGILLLTGHFGNWEQASIGAMLQFDEFRNRFHAVRKSLSAGLEQLVFRRFRNAGLRVILRFDALGQVLRVLERNDVVIYIMDQYATEGAKGIRVDFFGRLASTNRSLALLAAHSGAAVIPTTAYRRPDGKHVMRFEAPLSWISDEDTREEVRLNTRLYNEVLERFVLEHPDQWFWMHRRWKVRPGRRRKRRPHKA